MEAGTSSTMQSQSLRYTLRVINADLSHSSSKKPNAYCKVLLTKKLLLRTSVVKRSVTPTWNHELNFVAEPTCSLLFEVKNDNLLKLNPCLGQVRIAVDELVRRSMNGQEISLDIYDNASKQKCGTITVCLKSETTKKTIVTAVPLLPESSSTLSSRKKVTGDISWESHSIPIRGITAADAISSGLTTGGLQQLQDAISKLSKFKPFIDAMDKASKINPYFEAAWMAVSSLYKVYQKKVTMDEEIVLLVYQINDLLSFVEDTRFLTEKLNSFHAIIVDALHTIKKCCASIRDYLKASLPGKTWKTFSEAQQVNGYRERLAELTGKLNGAVGMHAAQTTERIVVGVKQLQTQQQEALTNLGAIKTMLHGQLFSTSSANEQRFPPDIPDPQYLTPPPPTEIFTGREEVLKIMSSTFDSMVNPWSGKKQKKFVLYGIGGMGKTQIALKFLQLHRDKFSCQYIIDASSVGSLTSSLEAIGRDAGIDGPDVSKTLRWLCEKDDWVLLYDNADDPSVKLAAYIPKSLRGNIIITTRNAGLRILAPDASCEVSNLEEDTAIDLLLRLPGLPKTQENITLASHLTREFGCLALAVVQAGSYIATRGLDLHEYQEIYIRNRITLFRNALDQGIDYQHPVYKTWEISFASLDIPARIFLNICAFLYRDGISEEMFKRAAISHRATDFIEDVGFNRDGDSERSSMSTLFEFVSYLRDSDGSWSKLHFTNLVHSLRSYSLIQESAKGIFTIHPLVHAWANERMDQSEQSRHRHAAQWLMRFSITDRNEHSGSEVIFLRSLLPHVESSGEPEDMGIADGFGTLFFACGRWDDAARLRKLVLDDHARELGDDDPRTLTDMDDLAEIYLFQERLDDVMQLRMHTLNIRRRLFGDHDQVTLTSMHNLALIYLEAGHLDEAEELQIPVLEESRRVLGDLHFDTLVSMQVMAQIYVGQQRADEAVTLLNQVIATRRRILEHDHPSTLSSIAWLATAYESQGRLDDAIKLQQEVVDAYQRVLGPEHSRTLMSSYNLASMYLARKLPNEAIPLLEHSLECYKHVLGMDHPNTSNSIEALANAYSSIGRNEDAEDLYDQIDHPNTFNNNTDVLPKGFT